MSRDWGSGHHHCTCFPYINILILTVAQGNRSWYRLAYFPTSVCRLHFPAPLPARGGQMTTFSTPVQKMPKFSTPVQKMPFMQLPASVFKGRGKRFYKLSSFHRQESGALEALSHHQATPGKPASRGAGCPRDSVDCHTHCSPYVWAAWTQEE